MGPNVDIKTAPIGAQITIENIETV